MFYVHILVWSLNKHLDILLKNMCVITTPLCVEKKLPIDLLRMCKYLSFTICEKLSIFLNSQILFFMIAYGLK